MKRENFKRIIAFVSAVALTFSLIGCKEKKPSSDKGSSKPATQELTDPTKEVKLMRDGNTETYWCPMSTEEQEVIIDLGEEKNFNIVRMTEYKNYLVYYILEVKEGGEWKQIYRQDEMESRTGVFDKTYTASEVRLKAQFRNTKGGIAEISFEELANTGKTMRSVSYCRGGSYERMKTNGFDKLHTITDLILFDFGSWTTEGVFNFGSMNAKCTESFMAQMIDEIRAQPGGKDIKFWFSLQNYDKKTENRDLLLASAASRKKLAQFALDICKKYNLEGIDVDYEYPINDIQWDSYSKFLVELKALLSKNGYKLGVALTNTCKLSPEAVAAIDYLNIMAYDCVDAKNRHSSYSKTLELIERWKGWGFKESQLVLGLPYYMHNLSDYSGGQGYYWLINRYRGAIKTYTNEINDAYFNGRDMIRDKTLLAIEKNLNGVFSWSFDCDIPATDERNLTLAVDDTINRFAKLAR